MLKSARAQVDELRHETSPVDAIAEGLGSFSLLFDEPLLFFQGPLVRLANLIEAPHVFSTGFKYLCAKHPAVVGCFQNPQITPTPLPFSSILEVFNFLYRNLMCWVAWHFMV